MSTVRSRLPRNNMWCCQQVMPVALIPVCAVSCSIPTPFCQVPTNPQPFPSECKPYCPPPPYTPAVNPDCPPPYEIQSYPPDFPPPAGIILINTLGVTPPGYLLCNGAAVSREEYQILFGAVGTFYGAGDGTTTFNVPNLTSDCVPGATYIIKT